MKRFLSFAFLLFYSSFAAAQTDSLSFENLSWEEMDSLLTACYFQADYETTQKLAVLELAKAEQVYGKKHRNYITSLNNNGTASIALNEYKKAQEYAEQAMKGAREILSEDDPLYVDCMLNLATIYDKVGEVEKSMELFESGLPKFAALNGEDNPSYGFFLNNFASLCTSAGQYERAIPMYLQAVKILRDEGLKEYLLIALSNLSSCYSLSGQFEYAIRISEEALSIAEEINATETSDYAIFLLNTAAHYHSIGNYSKALEIMAKGDSIMKKNLGEDLTEYFHWMNLHAILLDKTGRTKEAITELQAALDLANKQLGKGHPLLATMKNNLALMLSFENYNKEALAMHEEALKNLEAENATIYPEYAEILADLAALHEKMGNDSLSDSFHHLATAKVMSRIGNQFDHLSEREQISLAQRPYNIIDRMNKHQSFAVRHASRAEAVGKCFNTLLLGKGIAMGNRRKLLDAVRKSTDPAVTKTYKEWEKAGIFLSAEYKKKIEDRSPAFDSLEFHANTLENELARASRQFKEARQLVTWQDVRSGMKDDEAAIEFSHFRYYNKYGRADSTLYCAYILRNGYDAPRLVYLFEEKVLEKLFKSIPQKKKESLDNLYTYRGLVPDAPKHPSGTDLSKLVWLPLDSLLNGVKRVYYSPSGLLNRINFAALPINKKDVLADRYELHCLGSTRHLAFQNEPVTLRKKDALLFGGIRYDRENAADHAAPQAVSQPGEQVNQTGEFAFQGRSGSTDFRYLAGTLHEVQAIGKKLEKARFRIEVREGYAGTEEAFKQTGYRDSPRIIHVATHGFFFPDPESVHSLPLRGPQFTPSGSTVYPFGVHSPQDELAFKISDHPMIRSGLILAGANSAWKGEEPPAGKDDGILTAYEISQMNLSNTELVVLSACETGLGDIEGNEGVYGLQRAFKIAGVKYLMMSLWQVPDKETAEFMTTFYREWLGGKDIHAAFRDTQRAMQEQYPKEPFLWAGFVLVE